MVIVHFIFRMMDGKIWEVNKDLEQAYQSSTNSIDTYLMFVSYKLTNLDYPRILYGLYKGLTLYSLCICNTQKTMTKLISITNSAI